MPNVDFLPDREAELVVWLSNFVGKFAGYALLLGFSAGEVAAVLADALAVRQLVDGVRRAQQGAREWVELKNFELYGGPGQPVPQAPGTVAAPPLTPVPAGIVRRLRELVRRIKAHPNYTAAIGQDLGIVGTPRGGGGDRPLGTVEARPGFAAIVRFRKGRADGVTVESRRAGEPGWVVIATRNHSPVVDDRPPERPGVPERREYRLRRFVRDEPVGEYGDVMACVVGP